MKAKKPARRISQKRVDSFLNCLTGIGDQRRDKRMGGVPQVANLAPQDLEDIYHGDDMGAVIAEKLPDEMLRKGFEVTIEGEKAMAEDVMCYLDDLGLRDHLWEALVWSRVFGGAAIFPGVDDGNSDLSKPLNLKSVRSMKFFTTLQKRELVPRSYYGSPLAPKYGRPDIYWMQPIFVNEMTPASTTNLPIHESRLILFDGSPVTRIQRLRNAGWGNSVFVRVFEVLRDFNLTWGGAANLLSDWQQGIYKIHGLNELIASSDDGVIEKRLQLLDTSRSIARAVVLDSGTNEEPAEDFKRETAPLTGLPETLQQFALRLAAAARMPVTMLMGQSPAGLNATGEGDSEFFDDQVAGGQNKILAPAIKQILKLAFAAKDGPTNGKEPENWSLRFNPLKQLSDLEEADRRLKVAQADQIYISELVATPEEVAESRFGGDEYDGERLTIDMAARAQIDATDRLQPEPPPAPEAPAPAPTQAKKSVP